MHWLTVCQRLTVTVHRCLWHHAIQDIYTVCWPVSQVASHQLSVCQSSSTVYSTCSSQLVWINSLEFTAGWSLWSSCWLCSLHMFIMAWKHVCSLDVTERCSTLELFVTFYRSTFTDWLTDIYNDFLATRHVLLLTDSDSHDGWLSGNALVLINVVTLRRARLVLGWVTICGRVHHLGM